MCRYYPHRPRSGREVRWLAIPARVCEHCSFLRHEYSSPIARCSSQNVRVVDDPPATLTIAQCWTRRETVWLSEAAVIAHRTIVMRAPGNPRVLRWPGTAGSVRVV